MTVEPLAAVLGSGSAGPGALVGLPPGWRLVRRRESDGRVIGVRAAVVVRVHADDTADVLDERGQWHPLGAGECLEQIGEEIA